MDWAIREDMSKGMRRTGVGSTHIAQRNAETAPEYDRLLHCAWQDVMRAALHHAVSLRALYQENPVLFNIRELEGLLGITRKGQLATALRLAGVRNAASGPVAGLGVLRQGGISFMPYEVYTVRGAVVAWHLMRMRGPCSLTAEAFAYALLGNGSDSPDATSKR